MRYLQRCTLGIPSPVYILDISVLFKINMQLNSEEEKGISLEQYLGNLPVVMRPVILKVSFMKVL